MDNTEIHYVTYDPDAIWEQLMLNYIDAGGDLLYPGDEKEMLLRSVQADIVQVFAGVDNALRMATLRYAVGDYLDLLGENRGCIRIAASKATAPISIQTIATGTASVLPAGTAMTADGEYFYLLTEDVTLSGYQTTISATVEADREGSSGNGLLAGYHLSLATPNANISSITVTADASGGNEAEEDEEYRERILTYGLASITTGTSEQYEAVAKSVSSDIADAKALQLSAGTVGVYLIITAEEGEAGIIRAVEDAVNDNKPLTDTANVYLAEDVEYTLNVVCETDESSSVTAAINSAVEAYQEWQDNTIGRPFNPDKLMAALYQAGATRVTWGTGSEFDGGTVEYTEITASQRCKGTITVTA